MTPIGFVRPSRSSSSAFGSDLDKIREIERPGSPRARSPLLIHYHIFKNAGTSFKASLIEALGKEAVAAYDSSSPGGFVSARELARFAYQHPEVKVISSHQAAPPAPRVRGREVFSSILIRDPIARIRSMYVFERRQDAASRGAIKAKQLGFKEYVEWRLDDSPPLLCNYQVFFCSRNPKREIVTVGPAQLEEAIAKLDDISIVGPVGRFDEWLLLAQKVLSQVSPSLTLQGARRNVTESVDPSEAAILENLITELGEATAEYLLENNQLDMCLYQVADALLTRRLAEHGLGTLHQAYRAVRQTRRSSPGQMSN